MLKPAGRRALAIRLDSGRTEVALRFGAASSWREALDPEVATAFEYKEDLVSSPGTSQ